MALKVTLDCDINGLKPRTEIILSLSKETVIIQAKIIAIHHCVREMLRLGQDIRPQKVEALAKESASNPLIKRSLLLESQDIIFIGNSSRVIA